MKTYNVIIIGGGPAGIVTGVTIKEEAEGLVPCGIPYIFHLLEKDLEKNKMGSKPFIELGGEVIINNVIKVDKVNKLVKVKTGDQFGYGKLVFATGSLPLIPDFIPGYNFHNVFYIKKSYAYIKELINKINGFRSIIIVGGGFIGAEVAEQLAANNDVKVTLIESEPTCFSKAFSPELSQIATDALRETKVNVLTSTLVKEIGGINNKVNHVILSDSSKIKAEAVILSTGYRANSKLAKEAGLDLNEYDDIIVDNYGRTKNKDISAVGDCAQTTGFLTGRTDSIKLASTATAEARILGHNIFGVRIKKCLNGTLGVFSTEIKGLAMAAAGVNERNAAEVNVEFITAKFSSPDRHPGTLAGVSDLTVKLYACPISGNILGGEVWGGKSAAEIINIISMAIQKSITVYELVSYQIGTHPLLTSSPVNNSLIRAAEEIIYKVMQNQKQRDA